MGLALIASRSSEQKKDIDKIAQWLATTAQQVEEQKGSPPSHGNGNKPSEHRLCWGTVKGGMAKMAQTEGEAGKSPERSTRTSAARALPPRPAKFPDFYRLAQFISIMDSSIELPDPIFNALDRSIMRTDRRSGNHFRAVLTNVRRVFIERPNAVPMTSQEADTVVQAYEDMADLYKTISRMNCAEWEPVAGETSSEQPQSEQGPRSSVNLTSLERYLEYVEVGKDYRHVMSDFEDIRKAVGKLWNSYTQDKLDLISAAIATNTAIELARHIEERTQSSLNLCTGGSHRCLIVDYEDRIGKLMDKPAFWSRSKNASDPKVFERSSQFLWPTYTLLAELQAHGMSNALDYPKNLGAYDPSQYSPSMSPKDMYRHDKQLLQEILPEIVAVFSSPGNSSPVKDEIMTAIGEVLAGHKIKLWHVLAVQILFDLHHQLGGEVEHPLADLCARKDMMRTSLETHFAAHDETFGVGVDVANANELLCDFEEILCTGMEKDGNRTMLEGMEQRARQKTLAQPFNLYKRCPVYCGIWALRWAITFHHQSMHLVNHCMSIARTAYLYNVLRAGRLLKHRWKEMEKVMELQSDCFATGYAAKKMGYAEALRAAVPPRTIRFSRTSPMAHAFINKYDVDDRDPEFPADIVHRARKFRRREENDTCGDGTEQNQQHPQRVEEFIENLSRALMAEKADLAIDWLLMHRNCCKTLLVIRDACVKRLGDRGEVQFKNAQSDVTLTASIILESAASVLPEDSGCASSWIVGNHEKEEPLDIAAEILTDVLVKVEQLRLGRQAEPRILQQEE